MDMLVGIDVANFYSGIADFGNSGGPFSLNGSDESGCCNNNFSVAEGAIGIDYAGSLEDSIGNEWKQLRNIEMHTERGMRKFLSARNHNRQKWIIRHDRTT
jgi:hypothetical protein